MNFNEIKEAIRSLAQSQGFYCRLLQTLDELEQEDPEEFELLKAELEAQNFKDTVDMVLYFEC